MYVQEMAATARRVDELSASFRPDILHAHSPVLNALPALRVGQPASAFRSSTRFARSGRMPPSTTARTREGSLRYRASRALETFALRRADHVTTICEGLRDEIAARGIAADRITVIPNAVDTDEFRSASGARPGAAQRASGSTARR